MSMTPASYILFGKFHLNLNTLLGQICGKAIESSVSYQPTVTGHADYFYRSPQNSSVLRTPKLGK